MLRYSYTFRGEVASKKNHRQLVQVKGRGAVLLPSKRYREWDKEAKRVILAYGRPQRPFAAARLTIAIYHGDAVRRDTNNATQGIQDVLVEMGVLEDDNWMVIGSPDGISTTTLLTIVNSFRTDFSMENCKWSLFTLIEDLL